MRVLFPTFASWLWRTEPVIISDPGEDIQKQAILLADDAAHKGKRELSFRESVEVEWELRVVDTCRSLAEFTHFPFFRWLLRRGAAGLRAEWRLDRTGMQTVSFSLFVC